MCKELKEQGADVIVALTHLFISEDLHLAEEVPEIDIILGGHDHDPIVWYQKETLIMKTGQNAYFLGKIDLQIEVNEVLNKRDVKIFPSIEILVNKNHLPNQEIAQKVSEFDNYFSEIGAKPLACIETALDSRHGVIRGSESTMGNLILDALREEFQTDAALMSGGIIRGDRYYPAGTAINYEDLMKELPFENENIVIEVSGSDILKVLETGVARAEYLSGAFPQVSGIEFFFNRGNSPGERIIEAKIKGYSIEPEKRYTLATNTFNQEGGDGYFSLCNGKVLIGSDQGGKLIDTVRRHLEKHPHLEVHLDGRIKMISATSALDAKKHWID
jgi:2',3'-cyclic-nucleotide 2'-phosphodiesterase (5'-nucleotidase family)